LVQVQGEFEPKSRQKHTSVTFKNRFMVVFGGQTQDSVVNETLFFDTESNTWTLQGPFDEVPQSRHSHVAGVVGTKMFIYGGISDSRILLEDLWVFDLENPGWKQLSPSGEQLPQLENCASTVFDQSLWIFGGMNDSPKNDLMVYNTSTNVWKTVKISSSSEKPAARHSSVITFANSQMYLYGGFSSVELSDVWIFHPNVGEWEELQPTYRIALSGHSVALVEDLSVNSQRMLIFGPTTNASDGLISFLPEKPQTTKIIDCKNKMQTYVIGGWKDDWEDEKIRDIYWCDGFYDCENLYDEQMDECTESITVVYIVFGIIEGISIMSFIGFSLWIYMNSTKAVVKSASPPFLQLMLLGGAILLSIVYFVTGQVDDQICNVLPWYFVLGFHLMFGSLLVKNWRLSYIFNNDNFKSISYTDNQLALKLLVWAVPDIILLILNTVIDTPSASLTDEEGDDQDKKHYQCDFGSIFFILLALYQALLILYGAQLAWKTRNLSGRFNESKYIFLAIYTFLIVGLFMIPVYFLIQEPVALAIIAFIALTLVVNTTIGLIFVPKFLLQNADSRALSAMKSKGSSSAHGTDMTGLQHIDDVAQRFTTLTNANWINYLEDMHADFPGIVDSSRRWLQTKNL